MANTISLTGVQTLSPPEYRALLFLSVTVNDVVYDWAVFMPPGRSYDEYLAEQAPVIYADIAAKEAAWEALTPKTRPVENITGEIVDVPIRKEEIVKPDNPDYYAKRRDEYPSLGDQLDALWKGLNATNLNTVPEIQSIIDRLQAVKNKYPKPTV